MPEKWLFNLVGVFFASLKNSLNRGPLTFWVYVSVCKNSEILLHEQTWIPLLL